MPSSSEQRPTIHVQTLGGFSIRTNGCQINDNSNQSKKPWALLEYLVIFQKKDINPAELIRIIWADDPGVNPNGALKTLMFRSRKTVRAVRDLPAETVSPAAGNICLDPGLSYGFRY